MRDNYLIPKVLIHSDRYKNLQTDAAVLYAVLFDKSIMSDDDDDVLIGDDGRKLFITSPVSEIIAGLDFVDKRADILLRELDSEGLIKVVGQGNGNPPGIIVFPVSEGIERLSSEGADRLSSERTERREVSSVKLRYIGSPVAAGSHDAVSDLTFTKAESGSVYTEVESEPETESGSEAESGPEFIQNEYIPLHELQTPVSDSSDNTASAHNSDNTASAHNTDNAEHAYNTDKAASAPHPVSNRIIALRSACNNEFSPSDVRELWISMQDVIDEARWDDLDFLSDWLRSMYSEMHSRVAGGDMFVRIALLQDMISEKQYL